MQHTAIISDMLDPLAEVLTPDSAQAIANLKAKPALQARVDELAELCNEGRLSETERAEYETYVRVGNVINVLKAKAKPALKKQG